MMPSPLPIPTETEVLIKLNSATSSVSVRFDDRTVEVHTCALSQLRSPSRPKCRSRWWFIIVSIVIVQLSRELLDKCGIRPDEVPIMTVANYKFQIFLYLLAYLYSVSAFHFSIRARLTCHQG